MCISGSLPQERLNDSLVPLLSKERLGEVLTGEHHSSFQFRLGLKRAPVQFLLTLIRCTATQPRKSLLGGCLLLPLGRQIGIPEPPHQPVKPDAAELHIVRHVIRKHGFIEHRRFPIFGF